MRAALRHAPHALTMLLIAAPAIARAEDAALEAEAPEQVVKTEARLVRGALDDKPNRVESVTADDLARRGATDLASALSWLSAGADISPTGTAQGMIIDGLPASQLVVLRDGVPIARAAGSPQGPLVDLASIAIDPDTIERIDIYRGAGPAGSGAAGGIVIDIITRRPPRGARVSARGVLGSELNELHRQDVMLGAQWAPSQRWSTQLNGQWAKASALDVSGDGNLDTAARERVHAEGWLNWTPSRNEHLKLGALYDDGSSTSSGGALAPLDDLVRQRAGRLRLQGRWWLTPDVQLDHATELSLLNHNFFKQVRASGFERPKAATSQREARQVVSALWYVGAHDLGAEAHLTGRTIGRDGETGALPTHSQAMGGAGLSDQWRASSALTLTGRAFAWGDSSFGAAVDAQLGAQLALGSGFRLRANASQTRRAPTPEELFLAFDHSEVGYQVQGNPNLQPERLRSGRAGIVWTAPSKRSGVELEGFYHRLDDVIITEAVAGQSGLFTYSNRSQAHAAGLNASFQLGGLPGGLSAQGNYAFLPLSEERDTGAPLPLRSPHSARLELRGAWLGGDLEAWSNVAARAGAAAPVGSASAPPPYTLLSLGVAYRASSWMRLLLNANNLLDQRDPVWGPAPGRNVLLTVELRSDG